MYGYLYKYLILHKKLSLPGIGVFKIDQVPSRIDFVNKKLYPFSPIIRFTQGTSLADKYFYPFIAAGYNIDELEAIQRFNEFLFHLKEQFSLNGYVDFPGMGRLTRQFSNTYTFKPDNFVQSLYPDVHAERVVRKNEGHTVKIGEDEVHSHELLQKEEAKKKMPAWVIYAIILTVLGVGAIAYYYLTK
jgi:hypothetical protein